MLTCDGEVWCLPVTFVYAGEVVLQSKRCLWTATSSSPNCPWVQPHTLCVSDTKSPLFLSSARRNFKSHVTRKFLQWVFRLNVLSFVWPVSWKLRDSTVDDMLNYSLKALHVGTHAACHMTANIGWCRAPDHEWTHPFFLILGAFTCVVIKGLSVATHMDANRQLRTVLADQDGSRLGFVNFSLWVTWALQQAGRRPGLALSRQWLDLRRSKFFSVWSATRVPRHPCTFGRVDREAKKWAELITTVSIHVCRNVNPFNLKLPERDDETDRERRLNTSLVLAAPSLHW